MNERTKTWTDGLAPIGLDESHHWLDGLMNGRTDRQSKGGTVSLVWVTRKGQVGRSRNEIKVRSSTDASSEEI